jgi:hypothetical protein
MFSRFGKRFFSCPPLKQPKCNFKKIGLGVTIGLTCTFIGIKIKDRSIASDLPYDPELLKYMYFPSESDCATALQNDENVIVYVPWYYRKRFLLKYPTSLKKFNYNDYGIFQTSQKLVSDHVDNLYNCHSENLIELTKNLRESVMSNFVNYGRFMDLIKNDIDKQTDFLKFSINRMNNFAMRYFILSVEQDYFKSNPDIVKQLLDRNLTNITAFPETMVGDLLLLVPKDKFKNPNDFDGLILTGKQFNEYFASVIDYYKVTNKSEKHYDLQLRDGLIKDPNTFNKHEECNNGIHFSNYPDSWSWLYDCEYDTCHLRRVIIPSDAIVRIGHNKVKADKVILEPRLTSKFKKGYDYGIHNLHA